MVCLVHVMLAGSCTPASTPVHSPLTFDPDPSRIATLQIDFFFLATCLLNLKPGLDLIGSWKYHLFIDALLSVERSKL